MKAIRMVVGVWLLLTATQLFATPVTLTLTELTALPAHDGSLVGLTFRVINNGKASDQAVSDASLPGSLTKVSPPAFVGDTAEAPTFDLAPTYDSLRFDIACNRFSLAPALFMESVFDQSHVQLDRARLTFNPEGAPLDHLNLNSLAIPEPAALFLLGTGLAALAALTKKRKKK